MEERVIRLLGRSRLFHGMAPEEIEAVLASADAALRTYETGAVIFDENETPRELYVLLSGRVRTTRAGFDGGRVTLEQTKEAGALFGELYLCMKKTRYEAQATAAERSEVLSLTLSRIGSRRLWQNLLAILAAQAYLTQNRAQMLACPSLRGKIAHYLLQRRNAEGVVARVPTREAMAELLSVARPSLSRELSAMEREGLIEMRGKGIAVTDEAGLVAYL